MNNTLINVHQFGQILEYNPPKPDKVHKTTIVYHNTAYSNKKVSEDYGGRAVYLDVPLVDAAIIALYTQGTASTCLTDLGYNTIHAYKKIPIDRLADYNFTRYTPEQGIPVYFFQLNGPEKKPRSDIFSSEIQDSLQGSGSDFINTVETTPLLPSLGEPAKSHLVIKKRMSDKHIKFFNMDYAYLVNNALVTFPQHDDTTIKIIPMPEYQKRELFTAAFISGHPVSQLKCLIDLEILTGQDYLNLEKSIIDAQDYLQDEEGTLLDIAPRNVTLEKTQLFKEKAFLDIITGTKDFSKEPLKNSVTYVNQHYTTVGDDEQHEEYANLSDEEMHEIELEDMWDDTTDPSYDGGNISGATVSLA
ncbi:hypothetical protein [Beihai hermit crab virus 4]|uniref:Uncharacterized protein n=1 Tax=Beihai hermit crab virus 4 TaxID=1922391 RepID=A0A1L3KIW4_9NIDO|nr:hypothetical protein [Beihai hermit crab virus 4]APG77312.1 hypothetical protein [Beihai hermit crab virus 4]